MPASGSVLFAVQMQSNFPSHPSGLHLLSDLSAMIQVYRTAHHCKVLRRDSDLISLTDPGAMLTAAQCNDT
jgi:hypothetical protein